MKQHQGWYTLGFLARETTTVTNHSQKPGYLLRVPLCNLMWKHICRRRFRPYKAFLVLRRSSDPWGPLLLCPCRLLPWLPQKRCVGSTGLGKAGRPRFHETRSTIGCSQKSPPASLSLFLSHWCKRKMCVGVGVGEGL